MSHRLGRFSVMLWTIVALAAGSKTAFAQQSSSSGGNQEGFGVQVMGGLLFPSISSDVVATGQSGKTGWLVGLGLGGNRGGVIGVEADILYGQRKSDVNRTGFATTEFTQSVVDVPVMIKGNIGSASREGLSVFVQGGGYFDWLFSGKLASVDISNNTNGYEVGAVLGGGVEFVRVSVQGRYYIGLRDITQTFDVAHSQNSRSKAFGVFAAVRLN